MILDWDTKWALDDMQGMSYRTRNYVGTCVNIYSEFMKLGVDMDIISQEMDYSDYKVIVAPMMYMLKPGTADKLKIFVNNGGKLLATYATGYVDDNLLCWLGGFPGDGLRDVFGVISEEIDTLYPSDENVAIFTDGTKGKIKDYAEVLRVNNAEVLAKYESDYYQGKAAVTMNKYGNGDAYYVAARIEMDTMAQIFHKMCKDAGITCHDIPEGIEVHTRETKDTKYKFYINLTQEHQIINSVEGINLLNDEMICGTLKLDSYEVAVIRSGK